MAKGDNSISGSKDSSIAPKMDQYSVMHSIMDKLGAGGGSIAPSVMPGRDVMQPSDFANMNPNPSPKILGQPGGQFTGSMGLPRMGNMYGVQAGGAGSIAPSNPQDMMRRTMMNKGVYNQANASNPMI
jgi:hypothetical protein